MNETQIDMIFALTKRCPKCNKTQLTDKDKDKELILFKNKCASCVAKEEDK